MCGGICKGGSWKMIFNCPCSSTVGDAPFLPHTPSLLTLLLSFLPSRKPPHLHMFLSVLGSGSTSAYLPGGAPRPPGRQLPPFSFFPDVGHFFPVLVAGSWEFSICPSSLSAPWGEGSVWFSSVLVAPSTMPDTQWLPSKGSKGTEERSDRARPGIPLALETREEN